MPDVERDLFVAAFQKVASEAANESSPPSPTINAPVNVADCTSAASNCCETTSVRRQADQFAIQHLYEMAEMDEQSSNYERADQWRALAREIRQADEAAPRKSPPIESALAEPPSLDLP